MCKLCEEFYNRYPLDGDGYHVISHREKMMPIRCAFDKNGRFHKRNWNCMTLNALREIAESHKDCYHYRDDIYAGTIYVLPIPAPNEVTDDVQRGYIVMTCHKGHGTIDRAIVINEDDIEILTLKTAEWVIKAYRGKLSLFNHY